MYTMYINNTLPPALAVHEIYRDIFGPPMVWNIDIGGIDRRLLYRSLDASRDILKIQDGGRKRAN